ncbi:MAG: CPBP family intramembrane metalloprotease [Candidatus Aureabacteria bacterium]|nr:CPBP family intramembrane metalloprotease [Candidatus Auribacterota bacterium]
METTIFSNQKITLKDIFIPLILIFAVITFIGIITGIFGFYGQNCAYKSSIDAILFGLVSIIIYLLYFSCFAKKRIFFYENVKFKNLLLCISIGVLCGTLTKILGIKGAIHLLKVPAYKIIIAFLILITGAFSEEIFFRGVFLKYLADKWNVILGVILCTILFVVCHGPYTLYGVFFRFAMGIIYALVYIKMRNIVYPSICHFIYNAVVIFSLK